MIELKQRGYLVFDDNSDFVGVYTLAHKASS